MSQPTNNDAVNNRKRVSAFKDRENTLKKFQITPKSFADLCPVFGEIVSHLPIWDVATFCRIIKSCNTAAKPFLESCKKAAIDCMVDFMVVNREPLMFEDNIITIKAGSTIAELEVIFRGFLKANPDMLIKVSASIEKSSKQATLFEPFVAYMEDNGGLTLNTICLCIINMCKDTKDVWILSPTTEVSSDDAEQRVITPNLVKFKLTPKFLSLVGLDVSNLVSLIKHPQRNAWKPIKAWTAEEQNDLEICKVFVEYLTKETVDVLVAFAPKTFKIDWVYHGAGIGGDWDSEWDDMTNIRGLLLNPNDELQLSPVHVIRYLLAGYVFNNPDAAFKTTFNTKFDVYGFPMHYAEQKHGAFTLNTFKKMMVHLSESGTNISLTRSQDVVTNINEYVTSHPEITDPWAKQFSTKELFDPTTIGTKTHNYWSQDWAITIPSEGESVMGASHLRWKSMCDLMKLPTGNLNLHLLPEKYEK